jgi:hypothetical protein
VLGARVHEIAVLLTVCCGDVRAGSTALGDRVPALGGGDASAAALHPARSLSLYTGWGLSEAMCLHLSAWGSADR